MGEDGPNQTRTSGPDQSSEINAEFLGKLYFREVMLFSFYNPIHLLSKLREIGFEVSDAGTRSPAVKKRLDDAVIELEHFKFFITAIQHHLMREEKVIELLSSLAKEAERRGTPGRIVIDMVPRI